MRIRGSGCTGRERLANGGVEEEAEPEASLSPSSPSSPLQAGKDFQLHLWLRDSRNPVTLYHGIAAAAEAYRQRVESVRTSDTERVCEHVGTVKGDMVCRLLTVTTEVSAPPREHE